MRLSHQIPLKIQKFISDYNNYFSSSGSASDIRPRGLSLIPVSQDFSSERENEQKPFCLTRVCLLPG